MHFRLIRISTATTILHKKRYPKFSKRKNNNTEMYIPSISHTLPNSKHDVFAYSSPSAKKGPLSTSASNMRKLEKEKTVLCKKF